MRVWFENNACLHRPGIMLDRLQMLSNGTLQLPLKSPDLKPIEMNVSINLNQN